MGTTVKSGYPATESFVFEFASESEARGTFACDARSVLKILEGWNCDRAIVRITGQPDTVIPIATLQLMAEFEPVVQLFFADTSLPTSILKTAIAQTEEESRWGIVRLSDDLQVLMSSGLSGVLLSGVQIDQTTQWKRPEFWLPSDLTAFNQEWRDRLSEDGSNQLEYRYRIHKPGSNDPWEWYRSSYRLLRGEDGILYQVCTFIDRG